MGATFTLSSNQVTTLAAQAAVSFLGLYDGEVLTIPDDDLAAKATAIMAKPGWDSYVRPPVLAPRDFFDLFTADERTKLFTARKTSVEVDMFITLAMAGPVDLTNAEVVADINTIASEGLITADRAAQILAGTPHTSPAATP